MSFGYQQGGGAGGIDVPGIVFGAIAASQAKRATKKSFKYADRLNRFKYQMQVADLKAAGLNPMLAYGGVHMTMPSATPFHGGGGGGVHLPESAEAAEERLSTSARQRQDVATGKEQAALLTQQRATAAAQELDLKADAAKKMAETLEANARADLLRMDTAVRGQEFERGKLKSFPARVFNRLESAVRSGANILTERGQKRQAELKGMSFEEYQRKYLLPFGPGARGGSL